MNKSRLLSVCIILASLTGFTQSASATTLFGLDFDMNYDAGAQGSGWIQFDVDPENLPFDQWIDLSTVTGLEMEFLVVYSDNHLAHFTGPGDSSFMSNASVYITDLNPIFTVELDPEFFLLFSRFFIDPETDDDVISELKFEGNSSFTLVDNNSGHFDVGSNGEVTVGVWFDDPIPAVVPIPAAVWLFGSALAGLGWIRRKPTV